MKKLFRISGMIFGGVILSLVILITVGGIWLSWELHPWMPAGQTIVLGNWKFDDYEFQVWQRKNQDVFEPFADGLFVRQGTNQWQAFCFDIEDDYSPKIELQKENKKIIIICRGEQRATFDMSAQMFQRGRNPLESFSPGGIGENVEPPGKWWLR